MSEQKKVYAAILGVQSDISKIGLDKKRENKNQHYSFRGIDDLYNVLAPVLASNKLIILPRLMAHRSEEHPSNSGGKMFRVIAEYEFDFISAEDGSCHTVRMAGESMDSFDKATNKTASAAYKYACMQAFCIPTEAEDADADSPQAAMRQKQDQKAVLPKKQETKPEPGETPVDLLKRKLASCKTESQVADLGILWDKGLKGGKHSEQEHESGKKAIEEAMGTILGSAK